MAGSKVLALDPGQARIGIAVSNRDRTMAFPRPAVKVAPNDAHFALIVSAIDDEEVTTVVVGLPKGLAGHEGPAAKAARALAAELARRLEGRDVEVEMHDERLTTVEAAGALRAAGLDARSQKSQIDSAAAAILLEEWLRCQ